MKIKSSTTPVVIFWFRRDLRLQDNAGLYHALKSGYSVLPVFIFDKTILSQLTLKDDARVSFIYSCVEQLKQQLEALGSSLLVAHDTPIDFFKNIITTYHVKSVYTNNDYEPTAIVRDQSIAQLLEQSGIVFHSYKDQVIFEKQEVLSDSGTPYKVYTPYKNKWKSMLNDFYLKSYPCELYYSNFFTTAPFVSPSLASLGFEYTKIAIPSAQFDATKIATYHATRDFPEKDSTSRLGIHFRFGTISVRQMATTAKQVNEVWLSELIWREFFMQLLYHFPHVVNSPFNARYNHFLWRYNEADFQHWCNGTTGYPLVDAGMRELNTTGHMHNRARMVVASFLTKHLLIDWRWGEAYFAERLLDFDLSANNGNWQWSAGTGADAQPFFRIFNPILQQVRFDASFNYIKKWVPEWGTMAYPIPIVEHKFAVDRAKRALKELD